MSETIRTMAKAYVVGGVWFIVLLATAVVLLAPLDVLYSAIEADPIVRTMITMAIAIVTATVVAALAWNLIGRRAGASSAASHPRDESAETALATFR